MSKLKCEKCGKDIDHIMLNMFQFDGSDKDSIHSFETDGEVVSILTNKNWCGYDLIGAEILQEITCPYCGNFPFVDQEVLVEESVHIVCFTNKFNKGVSEDDIPRHNMRIQKPKEIIIEEEQKTFILSDADVKNDEVCYGDYVELSEDESNIEPTILNLKQMIASLTSLADEGEIKSVIHGELINKETTAGWKIYCKKGEKKCE